MKYVFSYILVLSMLVCGKVHAQKSYDALVHKGNQEFDAKKYDKASEKYLDAIKMNDNDFVAHYNLGNALYKSEKYEDAKVEYEKANKIAQTKQDKAATQYNLGNVQMKMNQPDKAAQFYRNALKQDPYNEVFRKNYEIAKLKDKEQQQKKQNQGQNQENKSGNDQSDKNNKGQSQDNKGDKQNESGGNGQQSQSGNDGEGNTSDQKKKGQGTMPKELEDALLDRIGQKEKETAKKILNNNSFSLPSSREKDW